MMAHNITVQLGGTAFLVCKVSGVDRVGVNWVCLDVKCIFPLFKYFVMLYNKKKKRKKKKDKLLVDQISRWHVFISS